MVIIEEEDYLAHYGILRRSGRYPWGSGITDEHQRNKAFLDYVSELKGKGLSEKEIAVGLDASVTELRAAKSIARNEQKQSQIIIAQRLFDEGNSKSAIGREMGIAESNVRALLAPGAKDKADVLTNTKNMLIKEVEEKKWLDVGSGVENHINVSETRLKTAVIMAQEEGYEVHNVPIPQLGTAGNKTQTKVLALPGTTQREAWENRDNIRQIQEHSDDGGRTFLGIHPPLSVDSKRLDINYGNTGGGELDGVIYVRPGVDDISLGKSHYAQVRILVDDTHYVKGMAMYKENLPKGVDLLFNTAKEDTGNKIEALKEISDDPDNPFGSTIKAGGQQVALGADGKQRVTSAMNILSEEGDWTKWSKSLSSQILSKQSPVLAKSQLDMTFERRQNELKEINALTNSTVRKKLLLEFADGTDSASVHLKAAALPRQGSHVILPISSMNPTEVYAPNYQNGERVVLIRHPHGGTFEIPDLIVNNNHPEAKRILGVNPRDAIGIHHSVAQRLSGADFDGDTVLVIPNNLDRIRTTAAIEDLKSFDPRSAFPGYPGMKPMTNKQNEMGKISNLITDMTIKGASHQKVARAVKHSMVVIDAEKHELNYKQSYIDNGISALKEEYQSNPSGGRGASTIISRAKAPVYRPQTKARPAKLGGPINRETGRREVVPTGAINRKTGELRVEKKKALQVVDDARELVSQANTPIERLYADHSNRLKNLANQARLSAINTPRSEKSASATKAYPNEVASLNAKLTLALRNRPLERQAQILGGSVYNAKSTSNPNMDKETRKKVKFQALAEARNRTKVAKTRIEITPSEWDAIQAGAISSTKLEAILNKANMDTVKKLATPQTRQLMTSTKVNRARTMLAQGYTRAQVAAQLGVSTTTLDTAVNE